MPVLKQLLAMMWSVLRLLSWLRAKSTAKSAAAARISRGLGGGWTNQSRILPGHAANQSPEWTGISPTAAATATGTVTGP